MARDSQVNRRDILRSSATSAVATTMPIGIVGKASAESQPEDFVGLSYHTHTHEEQDRIEAKLQTDARNRLSGQIRAAGFEIPVGNGNGIPPTVNGNGQPVYYGKSAQSNHVTNGNPLVFKLTDHGPFMIGFLTRPTPDAAKVGITIHPDSAGVSAADIRATLPGGGDGREGTPNDAITTTGIPRAIKPEDQR